MNDLLLWIKNSDLHNFADDNNITTTCNSLTGLLKILEQESQSAVSWFKENTMIDNAYKFQVIILNKKESEAKYKLTIDNNDTKSTKSVKQFGITNDDRLQFVQHISSLHSKAVMQLQLNALGRLQKVAVVNSFIYANFNYCPLLVWHFSTCELIRKIEKIQKCCLRIVFDDYDSDYDVLLKKSGKVTMEIK